MKAICQKEKLLEGLNIVKHASSTGYLSIINDTVLLVTTNNGLLLTCTNLELTIKCSVEAEVTEHGGIVVPIKLLAGFLERVNDKINITTDTTKLLLKASGSRATVSGYDAKDYPVVTNVESIISVQIPAEELRIAINQTSSAIATEESRPELTGVCCSFGNELTMVATNGIKLSEYNLGISSPEKMEIIVPGKSMKELCNLIGKEPITAKVSQNQIQFITPSFEMASQLLPSKFPDYKKVIPTDFNIMVTVDSQPLANACETAMLFNETVTLLFGTNGITIKTSSEIGDYESGIGAEIIGSEIEVLVTAKLISETLRAINGNKVQIQLVSVITPIVIIPVDGDKFMHIICVRAPIGK